MTNINTSDNPFDADLSSEPDVFQVFQSTIESSAHSSSSSSSSSGSSSAASLSASHQADASRDETKNAPTAKRLSPVPQQDSTETTSSPSEERQDGYKYLGDDVYDDGDEELCTDDFPRRGGRRRIRQGRSRRRIGRSRYAYQYDDDDDLDEDDDMDGGYDDSYEYLDERLSKRVRAIVEKKLREIDSPQARRQSSNDSSSRQTSQTQLDKRSVATGRGRGRVVGRGGVSSAIHASPNMRAHKSLVLLGTQTRCEEDLTSSHEREVYYEMLATHFQQYQRIYSVFASAFDTSSRQTLSAVLSGKQSAIGTRPLKGQPAAAVPVTAPAHTFPITAATGKSDNETSAAKNAAATAAAAAAVASSPSAENKTSASWKTVVTQFHALDMSLFRPYPVRHPLHERLRLVRFPISVTMGVSEIYSALRRLTSESAFVAFDVVLSPAECIRRIFKCKNQECVHFFYPIKIDVNQMRVDGGPKCMYSIGVLTKADKVAYGTNTSAAASASAERTKSPLLQQQQQQQQQQTQQLQQQQQLPPFSTKMWAAVEGIAYSLDTVDPRVAAQRRQQQQQQQQSTTQTSSASTTSPSTPVKPSASPALPPLTRLSGSSPCTRVFMSHHTYTDLRDAVLFSRPPSSLDPLHMDFQYMTNAKKDSHPLLKYAEPNSVAYMIQCNMDPKCEILVRAPDAVRGEIPNPLSYWCLIYNRNHITSLVKSIRTINDVDYFVITASQMFEMERMMYSHSSAERDVMDVALDGMCFTFTTTLTKGQFERKWTDMGHPNITIDCELRVYGVAAGGLFTPPGHVDLT